LEGSRQSGHQIGYEMCGTFCVRR